MIKVLVVDDSALVRKLFGRVLADEADFEVSFARNGVEALERLQSFKPDVITLDVHMPQMNGLQCLDRIMIERPCPVLMVSSLTAEGADATLEALRLGAVDFVPKPDGTVSLGIEAFAPTLVEKIRAAATAKLRASQRLKEKVQHRIAGAAPRRSRLESTREPVLIAARGEGIVLVGTSTGGPAALEALLAPLPATFPWPILVAQHMPASFTGSLARRLDGICAVRVFEASQPVRIEPGSVYIGRGDADLIVARRAAGLVAMAAPSQVRYPWHPSTNRLVESAMQHVPAERLIGILMTGMGNDGAQSMSQLHARGGRTIAEAQETAVVWGMPGELVNGGGADFIVPLGQIAERLQQMVPNNAAHT